MSKRPALYLFVAANIALGLTSTAVSPAQADERPCVSRMEYRDIRSAWPPAHRGKVDHRFDTRGTLVGGENGPRGQRYVIRAYDKCSGWRNGRVYVMLDNYSWSDERMRVWAMARNNRAYRDWDWTYIQAQ